LEPYHNQLFLNLVEFLMNDDNISSYVMKMKLKVGAISFNEKAISEFFMIHVVLRESRSFT